MDTFDYKPALEKYAVQQMPRAAGLDGVVAGLVNAPNQVMPSPFPFRQFGSSGRYISTAFEHLAPMADDLAFLYGIHGESNQHGPATLQINTGSVFPGSAAVGAWVAYGLGSENQNLPGFIVLQDPAAARSTDRQCGKAASFRRVFRARRYEVPARRFSISNLLKEYRDHASARNSTS